MSDEQIASAQARFNKRMKSRGKFTEGFLIAAQYGSVRESKPTAKREKRPVSFFARGQAVTLNNNASLRFDNGDWRRL